MLCRSRFYRPVMVHNFAGVVVTGNASFAGVNDTGNACISDVVDTGNAPSEHLTIRQSL
jgi:hypothetical protein